MWMCLLCIHRCPCNIQLILDFLRRETFIESKTTAIACRNQLCGMTLAIFPHRLNLAVSDAFCRFLCQTPRSRHSPSMRVGPLEVVRKDGPRG
ncbi:hypothetical protein TNCT_594231 [Trichonephila clavata]|uniref:Uncharacterized protein n=1 Tax=Trichonephila clavata TaxID=2740835 RepID=A0A8X6J102_TRICU|nr:hypothetical protein TNCT_594231 [Trichonephila clavata]